MKYVYLTFLLIAFPLALNSQSFTGTVRNAKTQESLPNVNVYYSGSSTGTITDFDGNFVLPALEHDQKIIVYSLMGFETLTMSNPMNSSIGVIELTESIGELPAVYLDPDPWSREKKEAYFKEQFLGNTAVADRCEILNMEDIRLQFIPSIDKMVAYCPVPIKVVNKDLGYLVHLELSEFEISFRKVDLKKLPEEIATNPRIEKRTHVMESSLYVATTYFEELKEKRPGMRKRKRHRKRAFKRSDVKFFQTIIADEFAEANYKLYHKGKPVKYDKQIRVVPKEGYYEVIFREMSYQVVDGEGYQSNIQIDNHRLYITKFGTVMNYRDFRWGGFISRLKVSGMLPLEYVPNP
ncbi:carboxypeptidase-like regulatory domain-containing protein [Nonlabens xiamenensis]|uniref:carboxypeptidase-like regulatory domain-containing protein n=1 Tax=Nonlabens xiamenensis TaxID=2341043 RepID=UPI000F60E642|nr:carboxypeptidase-like regulatory domain-containing protein [Nonlabens xiamenensis]